MSKLRHRQISEEMEFEARHSFPELGHLTTTPTCRSCYSQIQEIPVYTCKFNMKSLIWQLAFLSLNSYISPDWVIINSAFVLLEFYDNQSRSHLLSVCYVLDPGISDFMYS